MSDQIVFALPQAIRGCRLPNVFGISEEAARKYRERGVWLEGKHWKKDPVGRIVYITQEIENWLVN